MNEDNFPWEDPFDHACKEAASKIVNGEPLERADWDVLSARVAAELQDHDFTHNPF